MLQDTDRLYSKFNMYSCLQFLTTMKIEQKDVLFSRKSLNFIQQFNNKVIQTHDADCMSRDMLRDAPRFCR